MYNAAGARRLPGSQSLIAFARSTHVPTQLLPRRSHTARTAFLLVPLLFASVLGARDLKAQGRVLVMCAESDIRTMPARPCHSNVVRIATSTLVEITGRIARTTVTETFENRGGALGEADFLYPLPSGAAFEELRLEIDGKLVAGEVLDASSARATYERIVRQKRDPALVEWAGLGLLRTRIFPFGAGERRTVVVRHREVLTRDGDALRINGRLAGSEDVADERATGSFRVRWSDAAIGTPWSPTHAVRVRDSKVSEATREATLTGRTGGVLVYLPVRASSRTPTVTVLVHQDASVRNGDERHALVIVTPPRDAPIAMPRDITLAIDVSGSMSGIKLTQAVAAGHALLATLRADDRFQFIAFSDDIERHANSLVGATPDAKQRAARWLDQLEARGGTNIGGALDVALKTLRTTSRDNARLPLALLLTDGQPTVGLRADGILDSTSVWRGRARVFTFGVGADVDASLVEQLALGGRGAAQFVRPEESVERAVSLVAQRLAAPLLADVQVTMDGGLLRQMYAPSGVDLMAGQELVFLARYRGATAGRVHVSGVSGGSRQSVSTNYRFAKDEGRNGFVPRLWAVQRVAALDAERRRRGPSTELDDEMRALGDRYGVPTPLTSYLSAGTGRAGDGSWHGLTDRDRRSTRVGPQERTGRCTGRRGVRAGAPLVGATRVHHHGSRRCRPRRQRSQGHRRGTQPDRERTRL